MVWCMCPDKKVQSSFSVYSILTTVYYLQWKKIYKAIKFHGRVIRLEKCSSGHVTDVPAETRMDLT